MIRVRWEMARPISFMVERRGKMMLLVFKALMSRQSVLWPQLRSLWAKSSKVSRPPCWNASWVMRWTRCRRSPVTPEVFRISRSCLPASRVRTTLTWAPSHRAVFGAVSTEITGKRVWPGFSLYCSSCKIFNWHLGLAKNYAFFRHSIYGCCMWPFISIN